MHPSNWWADVGTLPARTTSVRWNGNSLEGQADDNEAGGVSACGFPSTGRRVVSRSFRTFDLAERWPALAQAVAFSSLWSFSRSMLRYCFVDHSVPAT